MRLRKDRRRPCPFSSRLEALISGKNTTFSSKPLRTEWFVRVQTNWGERMPSQALGLHRVAPRVYDLTGTRTGSIRDQLIRASLVANSLIDVNEISSADALLVIGAGAAGMCAAMSAAYRGANVTVVERGLAPFATFFRARWRRVDPCEYDWPHPHCIQGRFPQSNGWFPLPQTTGTGADLAHSWTHLWQQWQALYDGKGNRGHIELLTSLDGRAMMDSAHHRYSASSRHVEVNAPWQPMAAPSTRQFGSIINAAGFGVECTDSNGQSPDPWNGFQGPAFWKDDDQIPIDPSDAFPHANVIISGGGDGAMQDFQRVVTGRFGLDLLKTLQDSINRHSPGIRLDNDGVIRQLLSAEETGRRMHSWQRPAHPARQMLAAWHQTFASAITPHIMGLGQATLDAVARDVVRDELKNGQLNVAWVHRLSTPEYAYALNRFLCLVLQSLCTASSSSTIKQGVQILPRHEITAISPCAKVAPHACVQPKTCIGRPHDVTLTPFAGMPYVVPRVDLIIVRHGANRSATPGRGADTPEQMTPYDIPV